MSYQPTPAARIRNGEGVAPRPERAPRAETGQSTRRDSMGSTFEARRAGT